MRTVMQAGALASAILLVAACGSTTEEQAASGAMGGAVAGAVVGGPIGAAVGAAAGGAGGSQRDRVAGALGADGDLAAQRIDASSQPLADRLSDRGGFSTFTRLVQEAGLTQELAGEEVTVFAPTDDAFARLPAETSRRLQAEPELLRSVLRSHVVTGQVLAANEIPETLTTVGGGQIRVRLVEGVPVLAAAQAGPARADAAPPRQPTAPEEEVALGGREARIITGNIGFDGGVVHGIDSVLLPTGG